MNFDQIKKGLQSLNKEELMKLNKVVVRLIRVHVEMEVNQFSVGNRVSFEDKQGKVITGTVTRVNRKTLSITPDENKFATWNVSPCFVTMI